MTYIFIKKLVVAIYAAIVGEVSNYRLFKAEEKSLIREKEEKETVMLSREDIKDAYYDKKHRYHKSLHRVLEQVGHNNYLTVCVMDHIEYHKNKLVKNTLAENEWEIGYHREQIKGHMDTMDAYGKRIAAIDEELESLPDTYKDCV